jgi:hypothetical protein
MSQNFFNVSVPYRFAIPGDGNTVLDNASDAIEFSRSNNGKPE